MIIELRQKSQITIPSELIKKLSLKSGDKFEISIKKGALILTPVTVYPKNYVEELEKELILLKRQTKDGKTKVFNDIDEALASLDK